MLQATQASPFPSRGSGHDRLARVPGHAPSSGLGLGISLVAGLFYVAAWELCLVLMEQDFAASFANSMVEGARAKGVDGAELARVVDEARSFEAMYRNPLLRMPMTFAEIFPVGVLVSLISALVLRNPRVLPARG